MKALKNLFATVIVAGLAAFLPSTSHGQFVSFGTNDARSTAPLIKPNYHFLEKHAMHNPGVIPGAAGSVQAIQNKPGNVNNQTLNIIATNLEANTTYQLIALMGDDKYFLQVGAFTTDLKGKLALRFLRMDDGNGNVKTNALGKRPLPELLQPVYSIRQLLIQDSADQTVLRANFYAPNQFQYMVRRLMTNDGFDADAWGVLRINGNTNQATVRVTASSLETNAAYFLRLNGGITATTNATKYGKVIITTRLGNPLDILALRTVSISDSASNSVLSATLP